jgi:hypothetical protein
MSASSWPIPFSLLSLVGGLIQDRGADRVLGGQLLHRGRGGHAGCLLHEHHAVVAGGGEVGVVGGSAQEVAGLAARACRRRRLAVAVDEGDPQRLPPGVPEHDGHGVAELEMVLGGDSL